MFLCKSDMEYNFFIVWREQLINCWLKMIEKDVFACVTGEGGKDSGEEWRRSSELRFSRSAVKLDLKGLPGFDYLDAQKWLSTKEWKKAANRNSSHEVPEFSLMPSVNSLDDSCPKN